MQRLFFHVFNCRLTQVGPAFLCAALLTVSLPKAWGEEEYAGKPLMSLVRDNLTEEEALVLIENGADIQTESPGEFPFPLMYFAARGDTQVIEALLKKGVDVNAAPATGITALMCAAQRGKKEAAEMLIAAKADVNLEDKRKRTAITHAASNGHGEIVEILEKAGGDPASKYLGGYNDLMLAAIRGDIGAAEKALADGTDLNGTTTDPPGWTALHLAVMKNQSDMLAWLLAKKPELEGKSFQGTPLAMAIALKRADLADQLRAAGAKE